MSHNSVAKSVREHKEDHPERYCPAHGCLWSTWRQGGGYCERHAPLVLTEAEREEFVSLPPHKDEAWEGRYGK